MLSGGRARSWRGKRVPQLVSVILVAAVAAGCGSPAAARQKSIVLQVRRVEGTTRSCRDLRLEPPSLASVTLAVHGVTGRCYRLSRADLALKRVPTASLVQLGGTSWAVGFTLSASQRRAFDRMAGRDDHALVAFVIGGEVQSVVKLNTTAFPARMEIAGDFTKRHAKELAGKIGRG